jgi:hypothetical protein
MKKEIIIDGETYVLKEKDKSSNPIMEIPYQRLEWGKTCDKELNWEDAKKWCEEQGEGWRLPTRLELLEAYEQKVSGFATSLYWSSTENGSSSAWYENFSNGYQDDDYKDFGFYVRCIRSI